MACTHTADAQGQGGWRRGHFSLRIRACAAVGFPAQESCEVRSASSASLVGLLLLLLRHSFTLSVVLSLRTPQVIVNFFTLVIRRSPLLLQQPRLSRGGGSVLAIPLSVGAHVMSSELWHARTAGIRH